MAKVRPDAPQLILGACRHRLCE